MITAMDWRASIRQMKKWEQELLRSVVMQNTNTVTKACWETRASTLQDPDIIHCFQELDEARNKGQYAMWVAIIDMTQSIIYAGSMEANTQHSRAILDRFC